jgi:hypothetical protein
VKVHSMMRPAYAFDLSPTPECNTHHKKTLS